MFGLIAYLGECLVVSAIITFLFIVTRSMQARDETRSWKVFAQVLVVVLLLPYGAVEVVTRTIGKKMAPAVKEAIAESDFTGDFSYYKVLFTNGQSARVIAVGSEEQDWGGTETVVMAMTLVKTNDKWKADSYRYVQSDTRNHDGITFPPYW